jgi:hypothetical protein
MVHVTHVVGINIVIFLTLGVVMTVIVTTEFGLGNSVQVPINTPLLGLKHKPAELERDRSCNWVFKKYVPSPWEAYWPGTSKTCTDCGWWNADLKLGDKVCHCHRCGVVVDRQLAGARNNFFAAYGMAARVGWDWQMIHFFQGELSYTSRLRPNEGFTTHGRVW